MNLNYDVIIHKFSEEEGGGYNVSIPLLGSAAFVADGDTIEQALKNLEILKKEIFAHWLNTGTKIEEPAENLDDDYSGKFIVRIPVELHRKLAKEANIQSISLNSYVNYLLSSNLTLDSVCQRMQKQINTSFKEAIETVNFSIMQHDLSNLNYHTGQGNYSLAG